MNTFSDLQSKLNDVATLISVIQDSKPIFAGILYSSGGEGCRIFHENVYVSCLSPGKVDIRYVLSLNKAGNIEDYSYFPESINQVGDNKHCSIQQIYEIAKTLPIMLNMLIENLYNEGKLLSKLVNTSKRFDDIFFAENL